MGTRLQSDYQHRQEERKLDTLSARIMAEAKIAGAITEVVLDVEALDAEDLMARAELTNIYEDSMAEDIAARTACVYNKALLVVASLNEDIPSGFHIRR
jgi:hypothetical protein